MNERREERVQETDGGQPHTDGVDSDRANEIEPDDTVSPAGNPYRFHELGEVVSEKHDVGTLTGDIRP